MTPEYRQDIIQDYLQQDCYSQHIIDDLQDQGEYRLDIIQHDLKLDLLSHHIIDEMEIDLTIYPP